MIILHGEDTTKSYAKLVLFTDEKKLKNVEVITRDYSEIDTTYLRQELGSKGLFGNDKCFVIKNLLSGNKSNNKEKLIEIISKNTDRDIILWENKAITVSILKHFKEAKIEIFTVSPIIFKFLDCLRPTNTSNILTSWKKMIIEKTEPEFIFAMLVRQIKLLIQAKTGPENLKLAPYPMRLITSQATCFQIEHLLNLYNMLFEIEVKIKTGKSTANIEYLLYHFLQKI